MPRKRPVAKDSSPPSAVFKTYRMGINFVEFHQQDIQQSICRQGMFSKN